METQRRLSVILPRADIEAVRRIAEKRATTVTAILRESIEREAFLLAEREQGSSVVIQDAQGERTELIWVEDFHLNHRS